MNRRIVMGTFFAAAAVVAVVVIKARRAGADSAAALCCDTTTGACASQTTCNSPTSGPQIRATGIPGGQMFVVVQVAEPPTGFTGACLAHALAYAPQLPFVCYSPGFTASSGAASDSGTGPAALLDRYYGLALPTDGTAVQRFQYGQIPTASPSLLVAPATAVYHQYWSLPNNYDSYDVLMTCYPHSTDVEQKALDCPHRPGSSVPSPRAFLVSNSCCTLGKPMTSMSAYPDYTRSDLTGQVASGDFDFSGNR